MSFSGQEMNSNRFSMCSNFSLTSTNSGGSTISSMYSPQQESIDMELQELSSESENSNIKNMSSQNHNRLSFSGFPSLDNILSEIGESKEDDFDMKLDYKQKRHDYRRNQSEKWESRRSFGYTNARNSVNLPYRQSFGVTKGSSSNCSRSMHSENINIIDKNNSGHPCLTSTSVLSSMTPSSNGRASDISYSSLSRNDCSTFSSRSPLAPVDMNSPRRKSSLKPQKKLLTPKMDKCSPDSITTPTSSSVVKIANVHIETPKVEASDIDIQGMIGDTELVSFCGNVLRLLKQEIENEGHRGEAQHNMLKTLPKLRQAFNQLLECTDLPSWLLLKAKDMKKQLESDIRQGKGITFVGNKQGLLTNDYNPLEDRFDNDMLLQKEEEWKRRLSMGKRQAVEEATKRAAAEKAGLVNFAKQCVKAIALLKEKIEVEKNLSTKYEEEKNSLAERIAKEVRKETEEEWSRRLSMVKREAIKSTQESLSQQFRKQQDEELRQLAQRVRAETEADWMLRLHEEQKNRRLSCQLKLTAAVERTSKRAAQEKENALAALAEELEKEKDDATKAAADAARKAAEHEWKTRYENDIRLAREESLKEAMSFAPKLAQKISNLGDQGKLYTNTQAACEQSSGEGKSENVPGEIDKHNAVTTSQIKSEVTKPNANHVSENGTNIPNSSFEVKREESVWYGACGNGGGMRRFSITEHPKRLSEQMYPCDGKPISHAAGQRNLFRGLSQDFSMMSTQQIAQMRAHEKPKRVSFVDPNYMNNAKASDLSTSMSMRDFSAEFALPSPIPIVSMPLDDTAYTPMVSRKLSMSFHNPRSSLRNVPNLQSVSHLPGDIHNHDMKATVNHSSRKMNETLLTVVQDPNEDFIQFRIDDLEVKPGELRGSLASKYREYQITSKVTVWKGGKERQHSTQKTIRYSQARQLLLHDFEQATKDIGVHLSFQNLFASFPPKTVRKSNSRSVAAVRAKAIQNYILSACEICARLIDVCKSEEQLTQIRSLLGLFFGDFL